MKEVFDLSVDVDAREWSLCRCAPCADVPGRQSHLRWTQSLSKLNDFF
jgi:hypothetical protein